MASCFLSARFMRLLACGCAALILSGCAVPRPLPPSSPEARVNFIRHDGSSISAAEAATLAGTADYILIGERHTSAGHHLAQAALVQALAEQGREPALGLEMFPALMQERLDIFNQRRVPLAAFERHAAWAEAWGFDFQIYQPIFQVAERFNIPVYGLNISKDSLNRIRAEGVDAARRSVSDIPRQLILPHEEQRLHLKTIYEANRHLMAAAKAQAQAAQAGTATAGTADAGTADAGTADAGTADAGTADAGTATAGTASRASMASALSVDVPAMPAGGGASAAPSVGMKPDFERFLLIQALWDSSMAENAVAVRQRTGRPVVILAGSEHVAPYGIAWRLSQMDPQAGVFRIRPAAAFPPSNEEDADLHFPE